MPIRLAFDPGREADFWEAVRRLPGFPHGEPIRLRRMVFESDALEQLPGVLAEVGARRDRPLHVVMDETRMRRAGEDLKALVLARLSRADWSPRPFILLADARGQVHTDLEQIERVQAGISANDAVLALGSGTITDIAKHACHRFEQGSGVPIPFVVCQTANSVSAFTSNMAPTFIEGVKRTLPSRYPDALVCDLKTLRDAPPAMTSAGIGDLLAAGVSLADWYLAYAFGLDESYTPLAETVMGALDEALSEVAGGIRTGDLEAMCLLAKLIALAGLAMSLSHATTPLSGFEHVFSHVLDMRAEARQAPLPMHGTQVAVASRCVAAAFQSFLSEFDPTAVDWTRCYPSAPEMQSQLEAAFSDLDPGGRAAAECWRDFSIKLKAWHAQRPYLAERLAGWPGVRAQLERRVWSSDTVARLLAEAGLPDDFSGLEPPVEADQARQAFLTAHWIRKRFTIGDLLFFTQWDREALWERVSGRGGGPG